MLIKKGDRFELYPYRVRYIQHGQEHEQWALPSKQWWEDFASQWGHTEIIEFTEVELNEEQLERLAVLPGSIPDSHVDQLIDFVLEGSLPRELSHPLICALKFFKEIIELGVEVSEREINEIKQGRQISDLEIRILELEKNV